MKDIIIGMCIVWNIVINIINIIEIKKIWEEIKSIEDIMGDW